MWLASHKGRRVLNFLYSWGAAVVIIGALFKLLHLPFGNQMLFVGMITEFFVFFISGFEQPEERYQWEQVFPELDSSNPIDREEVRARREYLIKKAREAQEKLPHYDVAMPTGTFESKGHGAIPQVNTNPESTHFAESSTPTSGIVGEPSALQGVLNEAPHDQVKKLSVAIDQLANASEQLARLGQLSDRMTAQWEQVLLDPADIQQQTEGYKQQVENLQRNIAGLNTIYELQLKGVSSQIDHIDRINSGLSRIKDMYDSSVLDSSVFRTQNEKLAQQLSELNLVYARLLEALTVNMNVPHQGAAHRTAPTPSSYAPSSAPQTSYSSETSSFQSSL